MEDERITLRDVVRESKKVIVYFFKKTGIDDENLKVPEELKKIANRYELLGLCGTVIATLFSFLLIACNMAIEAKMAVIGIMLYMLYKSEVIIRETIRVFSDEEREKNDMILKHETSCRASRFIGKVTNKVMKYNKDLKIYQMMTGEEITNCIKEYLTRLWEAKITWKFKLMEVVNIIVMLIAAIITNKKLPQKIFIPLLCFFGVVSFMSSAYSMLINERFWRKNHEFRNKEDIIENDILRTPEIVVGRDTEMRISVYQKTVTDSNSSAIENSRKRGLNSVIVSILEILSQYGLIILYLSNIDFCSIDLGTIAEITATLAVAESALHYIGRLFDTLSKYTDLVVRMNEVEPTLKDILKVYYSELERLRNAKKIGDMEISPFSIGYVEESENDKPFTLTLKDTVKIKKGSIVIQTGPSGSGKSTFTKMVAQRIRLKKSDEIPSTSRFMYYDETLRFGSMSIFEEMFCCSESPDLVKMQGILENLKLWNELERNCHDVWQWMKEKKFSNSLSNGQKQRLILSKMLYWMDDEIDVCILDEATSGLDDTEIKEGADASSILEYIVNFANEDKKRTVFISTHQDISSFVNKMKKSGYQILILNFRRENEENIVEQIV